MITEKQKKLYYDILLEILSAKIDIKYDSFLFKSLKDFNAPAKKKMQAYHLFFKSISRTPRDKNIVNYSLKEFNFFLDEIRLVLSENGYTLGVDIRSFDNALRDSKRIIDFGYYLK